MKKEAVKKRRVSPVLKKMKVGDVEIYPRCQYSSLNTTFGKISTEQGMKYSMRKVDDILEVTRVL